MPNLFFFVHVGYHAQDINLNGGAIFTGPNNDTHLIKYNVVLADLRNILNLLNY